MQLVRALLHPLPQRLRGPLPRSDLRRAAPLHPAGPAEPGGGGDGLHVEGGGDALGPGGPVLGDEGVDGGAELAEVVEDLEAAPDVVLVGGVHAALDGGGGVGAEGGLGVGEPAHLVLDGGDAGEAALVVDLADLAVDLGGAGEVEAGVGVAEAEAGGEAEQAGGVVEEVGGGEEVGELQGVGAEGGARGGEVKAGAAEGGEEGGGGGAEEGEGGGGGAEGEQVGEEARVPGQHLRPQVPLQHPDGLVQGLRARRRRPGRQRLRREPRRVELRGQERREHRVRRERVQRRRTRRRAGGRLPAPAPAPVSEGRELLQRGGRRQDPGRRHGCLVTGRQISSLPALHCPDPSSIRRLPPSLFASGALRAFINYQLSIIIIFIIITC